jgi:transcriptional regulator with XRE-family HTH domain
VYAYAQRKMGRRIRRARKALGWTQEDLGDATGIDQTRITVFERGRKSMHLRTFLKLANALNVDPAIWFVVSDCHGAVSRGRSRWRVSTALRGRSISGDDQCQQAPTQPGPITTVEFRRSQTRFNSEVFDADALNQPAD